MSRPLTRTGRLFMLALALALPASLAEWQVGRAYERAYFAERIAYQRHLPAPDAGAALHDLLGYDLDAVRRGAPVPRKFLASLPKDLDRVSDTAERKRLFFAGILPLILRVNELISEDRTRLLALETKVGSGQGLNDWERRWLATLAAHYGLAPRQGAEETDFARLEHRVDIIPPSLALAQAAIESGWGRSRFAREGNALYGQWTWDDGDDGIVPARRGDGMTHRIRAFPFLIDSVGAYADNLNRNPAYRAFRRVRSALRRGGGPLRGIDLVQTLRAYSERRDAYVAELKAIIAANDLGDFDNARLAPPRPARLALN